MVCKTYGEVEKNILFNVDAHELLDLKKQRFYNLKKTANIIRNIYL